jgi:hypothetical protein
MATERTDRDAQMLRERVDSTIGRDCLRRSTEQLLKH